MKYILSALLIMSFTAGAVEKIQFEKEGFPQWQLFQRTSGNCLVQPFTKVLNLY